VDEANLLKVVENRESVRELASVDRLRPLNRFSSPCRSCRTTGRHFEPIWSIDPTTGHALSPG